jgi:hypothetical protein
LRHPVLWLALVAVLATVMACVGARASDLDGSFEGDASLEGGCAWLQVGDTRYELELPEGYRVDYERRVLLGPDGGTVARFADRIRVTGQVAEGRLSFCQVGPLFEVTGVQAGGG